jgi:hypothetical protein
VRIGPPTFLDGRVKAPSKHVAGVPATIKRKMRKGIETTHVLGL